jgi:two-component sensor histidine kinase/predicted transcriptional regulator
VITQSFALPELLSLEPAIDRRPLTAEPSWRLIDAIATLAKAQSSCLAPSLRLPYDLVLKNQARASALWVIERGQLVGQFSQMQALGAIAAGQDLARLQLGEVMTLPATCFNTLSLPNIVTALDQLRQRHLRHLPVIADAGQLYGVITPESLRVALQLDDLLKALPLTAVLQPVLQAPATTAVLSLAQQMAAADQDCVVLTGADDSPVGLLLLQDVLLLQRLSQNLSQMTAEMVMRTQLPQFTPQAKVLQTYWQMQQQQSQHSLVIEEGELLGLVTFTSCLNQIDLETVTQTETRLQQSILDHAASRSEPAAPPESEIVELREQLESSRLLAAMALHIRESLQLSDILQTAVDEVRQFLQTERVLIYQFNPDMSGTVVVESVAAGWPPALNSTVRDSCFGKVYAQAYQQGRTQVVEDIYAAGLSQCHIDILVLYDVRASLVVPILQGNHLWGLLCAYHCSGPKAWRSLDVDLLKQLAIHIAIAIQQSELYQQAQSELAERERAQTQLKSSLREKEALLKEIHHRVKNNLQIISSVLRLQSDFVRDSQVMALFNDSQNRIRSMALIHEKLYQSRDLLHIGMDEYIRDLTSNLLASYAARQQQITLAIQASSIWLNIDTAIPCGLIINELVSNALKHAFPKASCSDRKVWVEMTQTHAHRFTLTVGDNGIGLPSGMDFRNTESLGLELVCIFTEQLEGTIELTAQTGTQFTIAFQAIGDLAGND